jgi:DNA-binding GntR family transcriptional regulator
LEKQSVRIQKLLELDILAGKLKPGEKLDEAKLAKRFKVSRTPVREAISMLASENMVEMHPGRSSIVAAFSVQQVFDMYEVLAVLEGLCANLAARRMSEEERQKLKKLHLKMGKFVDTNDWALYRQMDEGFHQLIYSGSHNQYLAEKVKSIRNRMMPYRRHYMEPPHRVEVPYQEHTRIVEAILEGNGVEADASLKEHSSIRADGISDFIAALTRDFPDIKS